MTSLCLTDSHGFPLDPSHCPHCARTNYDLNREFIARLWNSALPSGHDERLEREDRSQDYPPDDHNGDFQ